MNGLKISPKKCQLFRTELQYMGNTIFIKGRRVCNKPLRSRLEAKEKHTEITTTYYSQGLQKFGRNGKFLSMFCPELKKLLKAIYNLKRKGRQFIWGKE